VNDDVKAAADAALVESMVQQLRDCVSVGDEMTLNDASLIDDAVDWIEGEPARTAAAVAAAAKPLADRIAELEAAFIDEHKAQSKAIEMLVKAEAERDALRARDVSDHPGGALLVAEVASLRAQVEAARATLHRYIHEDDANSYPADEVISDILAAMDGAKP